MIPVIPAIPGISTNSEIHVIPMNSVITLISMIVVNSTIPEISWFPRISLVPTISKIPVIPVIALVPMIPRVREWVQAKPSEFPPPSPPILLSNFRA